MDGFDNYDGFTMSGFLIKYINENINVKKEYIDTLRFVFNKKHDFLYIDTTQDPDKMLHKNFNQLSIRSPNISED